MYVQLDLSTVPPSITLVDANDFTGFAVVAESVEHIHVEVAQLKALAGPLASDPGWLAQLDAMLDYAETKGWILDGRAIRAHVEWSSPSSVTS